MPAKFFSFFSWHESRSRLQYQKAMAVARPISDQQRDPHKAGLKFDCYTGTRRR
jgi:hypothetical protein